MKGLLLLLSLLLLSPSRGTEVYEIAEPDLLEEIEARKEEVFEKIEEVRKEVRETIENYKGEELVPAEKNRKYVIDPTYCLEEDVYYLDEENNEWKVLYPKGYCFNPLYYVPYTPPPMVVFNPCRKEEREWVLERFSSENAILVSTGCPLKEVKKLGLTTYFLTPELKEKLRLKETVSVVSVNEKKKVIEVEVFRVDAGRGKGRASGGVEEETE